MNPATREELFFNALINGDSNIPEPKTREEELFVKLIEKINKPTYVTLYKFSNPYIYSKNVISDEYKLTMDDVKDLYKTSPLYFKKCNINGEVLSEGFINKIYELNGNTYVNFNKFMTSTDSIEII